MRLDRITGYQTVVSVDGGQVSNFFLQFRDDTRRFAFVRLPSDGAQGAPSFPAATFDPVAGQWYLLTGVFDATARTLSLYVDGRLQDTTPAPAPWTPSGHLVIGRGKFAGNPVDFTQGAIDDVRVYDQALTAADVAQLATSGTWRLDEGAGTTAADDSLEGNDGTLSAGATWTTGVVGPHAVAFDGSTGAIDVPAPVLDTAQGFRLPPGCAPTRPRAFRPRSASTAIRSAASTCSAAATDAWPSRAWPPTRPARPRASRPPARRRSPGSGTTSSASTTASRAR